jgi:hypothetical protein
MSTLIDHDESALTDAMTVAFTDPTKPVTDREQAIYNAAYIKGRRDFARETKP